MKYRCKHCQTVFEQGDVRDCCMEASLAEQRRLRARVDQLRKDLEHQRLMRRAEKVSGDLADLISGGRAQH